MSPALVTDDPTAGAQPPGTGPAFAAPETRIVSPRPQRRGGRLAVAIVAATLLMAGLVVLVHPTLLRPLIQHLVRSQSGRAIEFSALRLGLDNHFEPRIDLDDLMIENVRWAASREPMVRARKVSLELSWHGVTSGVWTVRRIVLEDASIDLERDAQGRRNSRLATVDGSGRSRAQVLSVDAVRSRVQIHDQVAGLDLVIASAPLAATPPLAGHGDLPLTRLLTFEGRQKGAAFNGEARVSETLTLRQTATDFAVQAEIRSAGSRFTVAGVLADLLTPTRAEVDLHLQADTLSAVRPAPPIALPALRQVAADAHLSLAARRWSFSRLHARSARSEVEGSLEIRQGRAAGERPKLLATLAAARLDLAELIEAESRQSAQALAAKAAGPAAVTKPADAAVGAASAPPTAAGALPAASFDWNGLGRGDGDVDLRIGQLFAPRGIVAQDTRLHATLDRARLQIALLGSSLYSGQATGQVQLDAAKSPAQATLDLRLAGVRLDRWPGDAFHGQIGAGTLAATAGLRTQGRSLSEFASGASGTLEASLDGATISERLEAKLALDGIGFLKSLVRGEARVPLRCAALTLSLQGGHATIRSLALDTPRTAVSGRGSLDLIGRTLDVVLAPQPHVATILALDKDIRIQGPLHGPRLSLQARDARPAASGCRAG